MNKEEARVLMGAMQMFEHLMREPIADRIAIDAFCLVSNTLNDYAYPEFQQVISKEDIG